MIFGKTVERQEFEEQERTKKKIFGIKKFALLPKRLKDGREVWLGYYYEYLQGKYDFGTFKIYDDDPIRHLELNVSKVKLHINYGSQFTKEQIEETFKQVHGITGARIVG